jgi:chloramphenicol-sensitive protein RarD
LISQRKNLLFDRLLVLTVQITFSLIILSPFYGQLVVTAPLEISFYLHIVFIAVVFTIFPLFLNLFALKGLPSATIGIMMYLNPIIGFAIAFLYFHETTGIWQILGYVFIAIAIVVFNYQALSGKIKSKVREEIEA